MIAAAAALASITWHTGGRFIAPLDDAYIFLSYARRLAEGHPFSFNPGDPMSTGATSLLYTILLSPLAVTAGKSEVVSLVGIVILNALLLWWSLRSAWRISLDLGLNGFMSHSAVLSAIICGPVIWGFFCGLDTGLMIALSLALWKSMADGLAEKGRRIGPATVFLSAGLALSRPEGAVIALVMGLVTSWIELRQGSAIRARAAALTGAGAFALSLLPAILVTGSILPSSGWAKTQWASPVVPTAAALTESVRFAVDALKGIWAGSYPSEAPVGLAGNAAAGNEVIYCFPPAAIIFFFLGAGLARPATTLGASAWTAGFVLVSVVLPVGWHHHRYLIPLFPLFTLVSFAGISRAGELFSEPGRKILPRLIAAGWLAFTVPGIIRHLIALGEGAESHLAHHRRMAEALESFADKGDVAASDVGILRWFGSRRIVDLKGLTAPRLAPASLRGWGSLYDEFKNKATGQRPSLAALHSFREDVNAEQMERAGILRRLFAFPHPGRPSEFVLYGFNWFPSGRQPSIKGWSVIDELDCALPASETAHSYRITALSREGTPYNSVQARFDATAGQTVGDGGWVTNGMETFVIRARPNRPLVLLMRTYAPRPSSMNMQINGYALGTVQITAREERFQTIIAAQVLAERVRGKNHFRTTCDWPRAREYSSFHYWALQPEEE